MPHNPSLPEEIAERVLGRFTALSGANTAAQNSDIATLIGNVAEEISIVDRRYAEFVNAHHFRGVRGPLLKERTDQLPKDFPKQKAASPATGGAFTLKRVSGAAAVTLTAGTIKVCSLYKTNIVYTNVEDVTFGIGIIELTASVSFTCATGGSAGTAGAGDISVAVESPNDVVSYARNTAGLTGVDEETDDELIRRAERWLWAQAQTQREAIETVAENFRSSSDPTRILSARCWTDIEHPGYAEVYLDNGTAMQGFTRAAVPRTGIFPVVPSGRRHMLTFDFPAASPPKLRVTSATTGIVTIYEAVLGAWVAQEENGELWIRRSPEQYGLVFAEGDTWETYGHTVYTGITVELQRHLERYCTALGCRVRARHGVPQDTNVYGNVVIVTPPGRTREQVVLDIKDNIIAFMQRIPAGSPLILHDLHAYLKLKVRGLINIIFDHGDKYPGGQNRKLVTSRTLIVLR